MSKFSLLYRPRRLRRTPKLRAMLRETSLSANDLIYPLFVRHGDGRTPISSMPGIDQLSVAEAVVEAEKAADLGVPALILFGIPAQKDPIGLENFAEDGIVQQAIRAIKATLPDMVVITDVCLCEYTDHGHCGVLDEMGNVLNDETLEILARTAVSHAEAGADIAAPSGMMDGMVAAIREGLDDAGFTEIPIMSYAVKYASAFYGPFRGAADSSPSFGDRKTYQMDPANTDEALTEVALDAEEGADIIMVKPALAFLDIISRAKQAFEMPGAE